MNLSQKKAGIIALLALLPAYFYADWQLQSQQEVLESSISREMELYETDQKLLEVCEETGLGKPESFGSNDVLCQRARERHKLQDAIISQLKEDERRNQDHVYWNFFTLWLLINAAFHVSTRWLSKRLSN